MQVRPAGIGLMVVSALAFGEAGCASPAPIVRLDPIAENIFWVSGRAAVQQEQRGVRVAAAFERQVGKILSVRVEIENRTDRALEVDPGQQFSFVTCKDAADTACAKELLVIDPEEMIAGLDDAASREQAAATNDARISGGLVLLGATSDTLSLASRHGATDLTETEAGAAGDRAAAHERAESDLGSQREMWSNVALRRNTLAPGAAVSGQVFVPADRGVGGVWLYVRLGARTFPFHFREVARQVARQG